MLLLIHIYVIMYMYTYLHTNIHKISITQEMLTKRLKLKFYKSNNLLLCTYKVHSHAHSKFAMLVGISDLRQVFFPIKMYIYVCIVICSYVHNNDYYFIYPSNTVFQEKMYFTFYLIIKFYECTSRCVDII